MRMIRVMLVDDQTIIRDGLRALLELQDDIQVVGEAGNGQEALDRALALRPDLVLMDIRMPVMDGVEAARAIKKEVPDTVVIMLTTFDDDEYIINAMTYGASGYLLKDIGSEKLVQSIRDGMDGGIILPGRVAAKITSRLTVDATPNITQNDFTEREVDIIRLLTKGRNNREIADSLFLSIGTVKNYISQIYFKIDVSERAKAVVLFKKLGF